MDDIPPPRMGPAQARAIAGKVKAAYDEVAHWQAAHPDASDSMVNNLGYYLSHAMETAALIDQTRRTPRSSG